MAQESGSGPKRKHALTFIFITVLIDVTGFGLIIPVLPELIMALSGEDLGGAATYAGLLLFVYALMQFLFSPVIGNLSDRFGRRPVLLISLGMLAIDYLIMGFAATITWLFIGRLLSGIAGATYSTAGAYIADVSTPEDKAQNFGILGAAFGVGFVLGPAIGGLLGEIDPRAPFFAAAGLAMLNVLYGLFVLPESLAKEHRRPLDWRRANAIGTLTQLRNYPVVFALAGVYFLYHLAHQVYPSSWSYYTMEKFAWSTGDVGISLAFVGACSFIVQYWLIKKIMPRLGPPRAALFGLMGVALAYFGYGVATQGWMVYPIIAMGALASIAGPALSGLMSNAIPENAQGELQGGLSSLMSLTAILSPLMLTQLFAYFTGPDTPVYFPGVPFIVASLLTLIALGAYRFAMRNGSGQAVSMSR